MLPRNAADLFESRNRGGKLDLCEQAERRVGDAVEEARSAGAFVLASSVKDRPKVFGGRPALARCRVGVLAIRVTGERAKRVFERIAEVASLLVLGPRYMGTLRLRTTASGTGWLPRRGRGAPYRRGTSRFQRCRSSWRAA